MQQLELGKIGGYTFRYFNKDKSFTKAHILRELQAVQESKFNLPDKVNPYSISRNYLFTESLNFNN